MKKTLSFLLILSLLFPFSACKSESEKSSRSGIFFDTFITLTVFGQDDGLLDSAFSLLKEYDDLLAKDSKKSDVSRLNNADGKEISINPKTALIIEKAKEYETLTDGAFSITLGAVTELWGFGKEIAGIPDKTDLKNALSASEKGEIIVTNQNRARLTQGAKLDLGAFAKGYIANELGALYKKENKSGVIDLGGNILTVGAKPDGADFSVGIKDPQNPESIKLTIFSEATSVVTSGIYERNFTQNGKLYHHIINPKNGYPAETGLASVTVICSDSSKADSLSTALFCMGREKGLEFIESLKNTEAVFIENDGNTHISSGLKLSDDEITFK